MCVINSSVGGSEQNESAYVGQVNSEYQCSTSDFVPEQTYGSSEPDFVLETLQSIQEDDDDDDDDDKDVDVDDVTDDIHVFHLGIVSIDSDEESILKTPPII